MCMFALTVSNVEPKNIKEAMADSAWIKAMQEELYQFDRLQVWELVEQTFGKNVIKLKWGTINMGLWYPKGSGFELTAFLDADHAGCIDTRKSTSGGIQFLGDKLVSWMSKKQDCTAMSSAEAEYVALSASCAQVENGIIELYFVRTEYQLADMFTKALPEDRSYALSWKPCQGDSLNLPDHRIHKDGDGDASFQLKSDSLPHAHAQTTKTFYKHQDSRIMKAQELKTKTSAQTLIYKIFLQRYQVYQGRLLSSFQDDAKYEHVGQDTRSQGGKDDQDKQGKDLKISDIKTKSKDNDKGSRSKITKHEGTSLQRIQRPRPQDLNDKGNLIDLMKECHNELTSGEIVSLTNIESNNGSSFIIIIGLGH
ncbi:hypothetical protein Tco_0046460 [Tanacetum coccineum]